MWKVLIADDEPKIRHGLKRLIERADSEVQVVAEAEDGEAAFEQARETSPDILFIDIRMPFLNGLELIERLNSLEKSWIIFVVTGHDEFEYARKALSLKAFDYLLKPVDESQIRESLAHAKQELSLHRQADKYMAWARERLADNMGYLREAFLRDWLSGALSRTETEESAAFLSLCLPEDPTIVLVRLLERVMSVGDLKEGFRRLMTYTVRSIVEEALSPSGALILESGDTVVALVPAAAEKELAGALTRIEEVIEKSTHQSPLVVTRPSAGISVSEAYEDARTEIGERGSYEAFVLLAQSYIERHFHEPDLCLETVAQEIEISPGYLSRLMKQSTGFSFVDFLTRARIQHALLLMHDPAVKVFEVAEKVGFRSQHYFSRAFRKVLGFAPTEYRKGGKSPCV